MREDARTVKASVDHIQMTLEGSFAHRGKAVTTERDLSLLVGASSEKTVKQRMQQIPREQLIVVTGDRPNVQAEAIRIKAHCLVITGGFEPSLDLLAEAAANGVSVICCSQDTAESRVASAVLLLRASQPQLDRQALFQYHAPRRTSAQLP